jgi:hypothetical protein
MPITLPALPFAKAALEPYLSARTAGPGQGFGHVHPRASKSDFEKDTSPYMNSKPHKTAILRPPICYTERIHRCTILRTSACMFRGTPWLHPTATRK